MSKKKVISVFGTLIFFALALTVISFLQDSGMTKVTGGAVYSDLNNQELFIGTEYEFVFNLNNVKVEERVLRVEGTIKDINKEEKNIHITSYALSKEGEIIGEYQGDVFLAASDSVNVIINLQYPAEKEVYQTITYLNDERTMIKVSDFVQNSFVGGRVIADIYDKEGSKLFIYLISLAILVLVIFGVVESYKRNKKNTHFVDFIGKKHNRKFIDLDIR